MAYFPLSQIITNLYTNGEEFLILYSKEEYIGPYHQLSTGKFFSGNVPNDDSLEIIKGNFQVFPPRPIDNTLSSPNFSNINSITLINDVMPRPITDPDNVTYYPTEFSIQKYVISNPTTSRIVPPPYYPVLTQEQKDEGQFTRYFTKRANELRYIEIDKKTYTDLNNKEKYIAFDLYEHASFTWKIKGDKQEVYKSNKESTMSVEQQFRWSGFPKYFKDRFTQFYLED